MKVPRGFESHPLRQRVFEAEKIGLCVAKSPRARRVLSSKSRRERSNGESARRFGEILSVSTFRRGLSNALVVPSSSVIGSSSPVGSPIRFSAAKTGVLSMAAIAVHIGRVGQAQEQPLSPFPRGHRVPGQLPHQRECGLQGLSQSDGPTACDQFRIFRKEDTARCEDMFLESQPASATEFRATSRQRWDLRIQYPYSFGRRVSGLHATSQISKKPITHAVGSIS
jgi:hypothetical protein